MDLIRRYVDWLASLTDQKWAEDAMYMAITLASLILGLMFVALVAIGVMSIGIWLTS